VNTEKKESNKMPLIKRQGSSIVQIKTDMRNSIPTLSSVKEQVGTNNGTSHVRPRSRYDRAVTKIKKTDNHRHEKVGTAQGHKK
jgi:hypothetical protein